MRDTTVIPIISANEKVQSVLESKERIQSGRKGQRYTKGSPELKAEIGRQAAEHSVAATVRLYAKMFPDCWAMGVVRSRRSKYGMLAILKLRKVKSGLSAKILVLENF